jgi:ABC-type transporter Mla subunit MlaD
LEIILKVLQIFLLLLLFAAPLYADQALVLSEIESIQEKIWYLQKDLVEQKTSLKMQQKQLEILDNKAEASQTDLNEQFASQLQAVETQTDRINQALNELEPIEESLGSLTDQFVIQSDTIVEQSDRISELEGQLKKMQAELSSSQKKISKALAETRAQVDETRSKIDALGQDVGGQVEQISMWGMGAALILAVMLTFIIVSRKDKKR